MRPDAWAALRGLPITVATDSGLINQTFLAGDPPRYVVQCVNPIFTPRVHEDIEAVTAHLALRGMKTPRLLRTDAGALCALADGEVWRVMDYVPGVTLHQVSSPGIAAAAARLVARFHIALDDLDWTYQNVRPEAHDTILHMQRLEAAVTADPTAGDEPRRLAEEILAAWRRWEGRLDLPVQHAHGDLKISNLRFAPDGEGRCLLDLDTLAHLPLDVELGDAWRSWCNPVGEDATTTRFDVEIFAASAQAYLAVRPLPADLRVCLVPGVERIALELAARFCRDVVEDRYFGWNPRRFPSRSAHNLHRALGQYALAMDVRRQRAEAERRVTG